MGVYGRRNEVGCLELLAFYLGGSNRLRYHRHAGKSGQFPWVDIDPCYEGLGVTEALRAFKYRDFVTSVIPHGEWDLIREAIQRGQLTDSQRFVDQVEAIIGRHIEHRKQGRPRKDDEK